MPVNINYAPVAALGTTGYAAGLGQYRQWQQEEAMKQQQMLLQNAQEQQRLAAQQQATQANINMAAPLRQAQATYYNDRGQYYGARAQPMDLSATNKALRATWAGDNPAGQPQPTAAPGGAQVTPEAQWGPQGPAGPQLTPAQLARLQQQQTGG